MQIKLEPFLTPRLRITSQKQDFRELEYLDWLNDVQLMRYSNQRFNTHTTSSASDYRDELVRNGGCLLALRGRQSGNLVGTISLRYSVHHRTVDVGLLVGNGHGGTGYGTEAWNATLKQLENSQAVRKITAGTLRANAPMMRILEQSTLLLEGIRPGHELVDNDPTDLVLFGRCL